MDVELARMAERIMIAFGGILSVYWGFRLFHIATVNEHSGGNFRSALFNISLTKVGPGVFFALFGAYIMSTGLKNPIEHTVAMNAAPLYFSPANGQFNNIYNELISQLEKAANSLPDGDQKMELVVLADKFQYNLNHANFGKCPTLTVEELQDLPTSIREKFMGLPGVHH